MAEVTIDNLTKEYGSIVATNDISIDIDDGELVVLVGPSGCGKTTTLRSIAGLETPTSGSIHFGDTDVTDRAPQDRDISMVFQDLALYPHMTAAENVAFPLHADGQQPETTVRESVEEVARATNCEEFLDKKVVDLSGGQRQRVALARALVRKPEVFLMDEPFSDLDELLKRQLRAEVVRIQKDLGITMVHVTHDQEEAMTMGDRLVVMNDGEIAQMGDPDTVFNEPARLFVATFIGSPQINRFDCRIAGDRTLTDGELELELPADAADVLDGATGEAVTLCIRPQHLSWADERPADSLAVPVSVNVIEKIGTEDIVRCRTAGGTEITGVVPAGALSFGQEGYLVFDPSQLHLFDGHDENAPRLN
ncbi:glycerol-3-phosphate ABC transporter ATP-binding protein [Halobacteriales archaeon QS_1_68_17]|nr:MAG: glycerol-3-phosphate ABC transporter ATP-binding protein [Halobacteriales archaeon QS_1_68_17]